ncbi:MAG TPA: tyrosine phenol-lyase [Acidobacteria bacterium]|nr:tyrosine phenol-lyase [Acidobacteriota bacterium]
MTSHPYPPEPFRIKVVEPIRLIPREAREAALKEAGYNLFLMKAEDMFIDLLTDSGTGAMSAEQWAALNRGDESYAGSRSWFRFEQRVHELTGFKHIIPTHQGRAAERILFSCLGVAGKMVINNTHFDTTRANVEALGGRAVDIPVPEARIPSDESPFKGNIDLGELERLLTTAPEQIACVMITVTNNSGGGQPASLENLRAASELCHRAGIPFYLDACRFAENAWFIKTREAGQENRQVAEIVREVFSYADGCTMSAKKDGLANIGGFLASRNEELLETLTQRLIVIEGFPTYGGLAGRDLEAVARGLREVLDENYLRYRIGQVAAFGDKLTGLGIPIMRPTGGHAVYIDAKALLPHIPALQFPAQALSVALYREGGVRGVEIGTVMYASIDPETGKDLPAPMELVRLAIPRRVFTNSHLDYVAEILEHIRDHRDELRGLRMVYAPKVLRHFTATFEELVDEPVAV